MSTSLNTLVKNSVKDKTRIRKPEKHSHQIPNIWLLKKEYFPTNMSMIEKIRFTN